MMLDKAEIEKQEEELRHRVRELSDEQRKRFYSDFKEQMKDPDTYAVLNYIFIAGLHHFYLGRIARGLINILVFFVAVALAVMGSMGLAVLVFLIITALEFGELFRSQLIVADYNNKVMEKLLAAVN